MVRLSVSLAALALALGGGAPAQGSALFGVSVLFTLGARSL